MGTPGVYKGRVACKFLYRTAQQFPHSTPFNLDIQLSYDHNHVYSRWNEKGSIRYDIPVPKEVICRRSVVSDVNDHSSSGQLGIECVQGYSWDDVVWRPELGTLGSRRERRHRACEVCVSPFAPHINTYPWFSPVRVLRSYEHGINTFDTADIYSNGLSEIYLGRAIKALNLPREGIVVMTKVCYQSRWHLCRGPQFILSYSCTAPWQRRRESIWRHSRTPSSTR